VDADFAAAAVRAAAIAARLGWVPDIFWAATPADLRHALGAPEAEDAAGGDVLARLMREFPDG